MAPRSFHMMPESSTAMTTSGRPVVTCHALSTLGPRTPNSSCAVAGTAGSTRLEKRKLVLLRSAGIVGGSVVGSKRYDW